MAASTNALMARSSTTELQNWATGFVGRLSAFGWVQTADTGQANFATITEPGSNNASAGYQIWRMADALQGTTSVFMRIDAARGNNDHDPALIIQVGFSTDGAGNINSTRKSQQMIFTVNSEGLPSTTYNCYFSGDTNRFTFMMWDDPTLATNIGLFFSVDRYQDASGNDVAGGVIIRTRNGGDATATFGSYAAAGCQCIVLDSSAAPVSFSPWRACAPTVYSSLGTMINGTTVGSAVPIPFGPDPRNPTIGPLVALGNDYTAYATVVIPVYSVNHTFMMTGKPNNNWGVLPLQPNGWQNNSCSGNGDGFILMRYE